jgi:uncharacterized membrane protein YqaE (UPF0057 family)
MKLTCVVVASEALLLIKRTLSTGRMTFGDIFRIIIALFIPPLGVFTQVGLGRAFWINLLIYLFAVGGFGLPLLFGMWPAAMIHALFIISHVNKFKYL